MTSSEMSDMILALGVSILLILTAIVGMWLVGWIFITGLNFFQIGVVGTYTFWQYVGIGFLIRFVMGRMPVLSKTEIKHINKEIRQI